MAKVKYRIRIFEQIPPQERHKGHLTYCITAWYVNCTDKDRKSLSQVIRSAERIIGCLPWTTSLGHAASAEHVAF